MTFNEKLKELKVINEELRQDRINLDNKLANYQMKLSQYLGIKDLKEIDILDAIDIGLEAKND